MGVEAWGFLPVTRSDLAARTPSAGSCTLLGRHRSSTPTGRRWPGFGTCTQPWHRPRDPWSALSAPGRSVADRKGPPGWTRRHRLISVPLPHPDQVLYFPDRWWHATLNLDPSVFISTFLS